MKPFQTHRQQIKKLRKRGLNIDKNTEGSKVMRILEKENYYNIINGYKDPFLKKDSHNSNLDPEHFEDDKTFDEIYSLYAMDRRLRSLILEYLLLIETHLKSAISYKFSEKFPESNSYLDIQNYSSADDKIIDKVSVIASLSGVIKKNIKKEAFSKNKLNSVEHYLKHHQEVPLWVLVNYLSIGNIYYFYKSLDEDLSEDIANIFSERYISERNSHIQLSKKDLLTLIHFIKTYRNACAHEERLYDLQIGPPNISKYITAYNRENQINVTNDELSKGDIFCLLFVLRFYLSKEEYNNLITSITDILDEHKVDFSTNSYRIIFSKCGLQNVKVKKLFR